MSFYSLTKGITPKICWFCLVLINNVQFWTFYVSSSVIVSERQHESFLFQIFIYFFLSNHRFDGNRLCMSVKQCAQSDNKNGHDTGMVSNNAVLFQVLQWHRRYGRDFSEEKVIVYSWEGGITQCQRCYRRSTVAHRHQTSDHNTTALSELRA